MTTLTVERPAAAATDLEPTRLRMSYEDFMAWSDEDTHAEWILLDSSRYGEVIVHRPPKDIHQAVVGFLYELLGMFVRLFDLGRVRIAPLEVKLKPGGSSRVPDIFFVAQANLDRLTQNRMNGPPDLVIEVVSDDSVKRDRDDKFGEYRDAGVREYWITDPRPDKQRADFYRLDESGAYRLYATEDDERAASQVLPGFWLRPEWLWQADILNPLTCSFEIEGVIQAVTEQIKRVQS